MKMKIDVRTKYSQDSFGNECREVKGDLVPFKQFGRNGRWPTRKQLYWYRYKNTCGFNEKVVFKIGRTLLVDTGALMEWLAQYDQESRKA